MSFTGERYIPGEGGCQIAYEHLHRYFLRCDGLGMAKFWTWPVETAMAQRFLRVGRATSGH
jgi:hypothetical protein